VAGYSVSFAEFVADPLRIDVFLVELFPYDPDTGTTTSLYHSTGVYVSAPSDSPASQPYTATATVSLNVEDSLFTPGTVAVSSATSGGEVRIGDSDSFGDYSWGGRVVRVIHVGYSPAHDGWVSRANGRVLYEGEVAAARVGLGESILELRPVDARLSFPVSDRTLAGVPWALLFDGSASTALTAGPEPKLAVVDDLTVEMRLYADALPGSVAQLAGFYGGTGRPWQLRLDSSGQLILADSATTYHTTTLTLSAKRWYHIAVTVSATETIFYVWDGSTRVVTTETDAADNTGRAAAAGSPGFSIGCAGAADYFNGIISQVRVWNTARTASELADTRHRRLTAGEETDPTLVGLFRLEEGTGDAAADSSALTTTDDTLSAVASGNKFTRASGSFVDDGWVVGMRGASSGFDNSDGQNNGTWAVSSVSATELAVTGITLVNEADKATALLRSAPLVVSSATWVAALEGSPEVTGTPIGFAYGRCESVPGILVHLPTDIYLVAGNECSALQGVYEGGNGVALDTSYTDLVAFLSATTGDGLYDVLIYENGVYVRFGSPTTLPVTFDLYGDATGSGYVETSAQIARRMLTTLGPEPLVDPDDLDTATFTALDSANSAPCGVYCYSDEMISDKVAFVLGSVGASGRVDSETGQFAVYRFGGVTGSAVAAIDERHIITIEPLAVDPPYWAVSLGYRQQYKTLSLEEIAGIVTDQDDPIVFRLQHEEFTARVEDTNVLNRHKRAGVYYRSTGLALEEDAIAEAQRLLLLVKGAARAYKIDVMQLAVDQVVEGEIITISLSDGVGEQRLGLGAGQDFLLLGLAKVPDEGIAELKAWRGEGE